MNGKTNTEKFLIEIATKSFFNLWCYPNPYMRKANRELCDLLVICDKHVIIFSDKNNIFPDQGDIEKNWQKWFKKAVTKSINQLKGAEKALKKYPGEIYLDAKCQKKLPIPDPKENSFKIHLVAIANGATFHCQNYFGGGGSGSLFFSSSVSGGERPFIIGDENPKGTFIHILDELTLPVLIQELDTITDFIDYLTEKEKFLRLNRQTLYSGEEDLLAHYMARYDEAQGKYILCDPKFDTFGDLDGIFIEPGIWNDVKNHPTYVSKKQADEISYLWDEVVNKFTKHIIAGTSNMYGHSLKEHEGGVRYMALETRFYRRILSKLLLNAIENYPAPIDNGVIKIATLPVSSQAGIVYLFIQFPFDKEKFSSYGQYREVRRNYLHLACMAAKSILPSSINIPITKVLGIATEPPKYIDNDVNSEDMVLLFCDEWSTQQQAEGERFQKELNIFMSAKMEIGQFSAQNFPDIDE